eukprot:scaffold8946_cov268-Chaetoceros_neogracile.AAC.13
MPAGIPDVSSILASLQDQMHYGIDYLSIPTFGLVKEHFLVAYADVLQASRSTYAFAEITSKPLAIIVSLIARYLWTLLKIVAEHTVYHAVLAMKETWQQMMFASRWFVAYQRSLTAAAIYMEMLFIFLLIGMYALRKYIKKKKYVERVTKWYHRKKYITIMKYNYLVDQVAKTSILIALLLPHMIYMAVVGLIKWFLPSVITYFANKTPLSDVIGFYVPFLRTIWVINQWRSSGVEVEKSMEEFTNNGSKPAKEESYGILSMFRKKRTESEYEKTIKKGKVNSAQKNKISCSKKPITRTRLSDDQKQLVEKASQLLQYWVVYALISAVVQTLMLLPVVSSLLSNINTTTQRVSVFPWKQKKMSWLNRIKPSREHYQEFELFFFVWLRLLPTSFTNASSVCDEKGVNHKIAALENPEKLRRSMTIPLSTRPIDIIYERISPIIVALVSSSSHLLQQSANGGMSKEDDGAQSFVLRGVAWCKSLLDVMVWTKIISDVTRGRIISTLIEWTDLLPAMLTIVMPGYFTRYGIIYASLVVPSANSSQCHQSLKKLTTNTETVNRMTVALRFLKYWVIHGLLSCLLSTFAPVFAWIPLSTHAVLIVWAYLQNEGMTNRLYNALEWDLIAFGLLNAHPHQQSGDINDTVTMKVINSIAKRVPSTVSHSLSQTSLPDVAESNERDNGDEMQNGKTTIIENNPYTVKD